VGGRRCIGRPACSSLGTGPDGCVVSLRIFNDLESPFQHSKAVQVVPRILLGLELEFQGVPDVNDIDRDVSWDTYIVYTCELKDAMANGDSLRWPHR